MKERNHSAEYYWRLDRNQDYFRDRRKRLDLDRKYVGGYVGLELAEALRVASKERGVSQTEILSAALKKELGKD